MSSPMYDYWLKKSHAAIPLGYQAAIDNYNNQKRMFLQNMEQASGLAVKNFIEQINDEIALMAESELEETFDSAFEAVREYVESYIIDLMQSGNASYQQLLDRFSKVVNNEKLNPDNLYQNLKGDIENFLATNNIGRSTLAKYVSSRSGLITSNTDIQSNLFGYARKLILQQLKGNELAYSTQHYKTSLKGYYKEELLVPALNKVLQQYGIKATQMGSTRNEAGQQIKYDILLGTTNFSGMNDSLLAPIIAQMESFAKNISAEESVQEYSSEAIGGIQSKSWIAPWSVKTYGGNRSFLSFGHNAALMPKGEDAHYWHAGVYNVMSQLTQAIGPSNFMFSTGDQIYWTADLLAEFRARQYVIAFYYNKTEGKIVSSSISAQPHMDN